MAKFLPFKMHEQAHKQQIKINKNKQISQNHELNSTLFN